VGAAGRDVKDPPDPAAARADLVDLAVVGLQHVQLPAGREHAVEGPVGLEVVVGGRGRRVVGQEAAEVGDHRPAAVAVEPPDPRRGVLEAAGAATAGDQREDGAAADHDVGRTEHVAEAVTGRRQAAGHGRPVAAPADPGDPGGQGAVVGLEG
jgi:hypothetical protein